MMASGSLIGKAAVSFLNNSGFVGGLYIFYIWHSFQYMCYIYILTDNTVYDTLICAKEITINSKKTINVLDFKRLCVTVLTRGFKWAGDKRLYTTVWMRGLKWAGAKRLWVTVRTRGLKWACAEGLCLTNVRMRELKWAGANCFRGAMGAADSGARWSDGHDGGKAPIHNG